MISLSVLPYLPDINSIAICFFIACRNYENTFKVCLITWCTNSFEVAKPLNLVLNNFVGKIALLGEI